MPKEPVLSAKSIEKIRALALMSDKEFADLYLKGLSDEELQEFQEECPDFPSDDLPFSRG
ncbi:MAG: hypothetical protein Q4C50_03470 [Eubacteriales bacterium]|nr:hypothetical protein [Eubacteriales bacterium]